MSVLCQKRTKRRMGRKPRVKQFAHGNCSIMPLDAGTRNYHTAINHAEVLGPRPNTNAPVDVVQQIVAFHFSRPTHHEGLKSFLSVSESLQVAKCCFTMGTCFIGDLQVANLLTFIRSPYILADGYHTILEFMSDHRQRVLVLKDLDITLGSRTLRSFIGLSKCIVYVEDAVVVLMLGQILLAYNAMLPLGNSTRTITRSVLWIVRDWYPVMLQDPRIDAITITPVLIDSIDCLVRREMPVLQLPTTRMWTVDRFLGVCCSLLPFLYDLCQCSVLVRGHRELNCQEADLILCDPYEDIERSIAAWEPEYPVDLHCRFTAEEVANMLAQARAYRFASLLIIHRLRYPFGTQDVVGQSHASQIIEALCPLLISTSDATRGLAVDFPLLVAMVEMPNHGVEVFQAFEPLRYRRRQSEDILNFVRVVQQARADGYRGLWFDLVRSGFKGDILP